MIVNMMDHQSTHLKNNKKRNAVWKYNLCIYKVDHSLKL